MKKAGRIYYPALLPEEPADPLLTKMLVPAPYKAPKKKAEKEAKKTQGGLRRCGTSDTISEGSNARSAFEEDEEEEEDKSLAGEERRGRPPQIWKRRCPRRERLPSQIAPHGMSIAAQSGALETSP